MSVVVLDTIDCRPGDSADGECDSPLIIGSALCDFLPNTSPSRWGRSGDRGVSVGGASSLAGIKTGGGRLFCVCGEVRLLSVPDPSSLGLADRTVASGGDGGLHRLRPPGAGLGLVGDVERCAVLRLGTEAAAREKVP